VQDELDLNHKVHQGRDKQLFSHHVFLCQKVHDQMHLLFCVEFGELNFLVLQQQPELELSLLSFLVEKGPHLVWQYF
jgi:hypothetical protein